MFFKNTNNKTIANTRPIPIPVYIKLLFGLMIIILILLIVFLVLVLILPKTECDKCRFNINSKEVSDRKFIRDYEDKCLSIPEFNLNNPISCR